MIQPVRPVCWSVQAIPRALYELCSLRSWLWSGCRPISAAWTNWIRVPLFVRLELEQAALATVSGFLPACREQVNGVQPPESWHAWPAHPPFADEVTRWWPSDEFPPPLATSIIDQFIVEQPPVIIDWRDRGGLVDLCI